MNILTKQIIAVGFSILILIVIFYGNYLPLKKSEAFIEAASILRSDKVKTLNDFFTVMSKPLNIKSPFGQEELVRQLTNYTAQIISQDKNKELINVVMEYVNGYLNPILKRGKGLSFNQNLYLAGRLNLAAYQSTGDEKYLKKAEEIFNWSYSLGPKRPQALYGLFYICQFKQDKECLGRWGNEILNYWPEAQDIKNILIEINTH